MKADSAEREGWDEGKQYSSLGEEVNASFLKC